VASCVEGQTDLSNQKENRKKRRITGLPPRKRWNSSKFDKIHRKHENDEIRKKTFFQINVHFQNLVQMNLLFISHNLKTEKTIYNLICESFEKRLTIKTAFNKSQLPLEVFQPRTTQANL
jgi:hypothetical protein